MRSAIHQLLAAKTHRSSGQVGVRQRSHANAAIVDYCQMASPIGSAGYSFHSSFHHGVKSQIAKPDQYNPTFRGQTGVEREVAKVLVMREQDSSFRLRPRQDILVVASGHVNACPDDVVPRGAQGFDR
jgi:hypothetical protein